MTEGGAQAAMLSMRGVVKEHRDGDMVVRALGGVDLDAAPGELVAVTGRSGSGKSTLLNLAGGLDEPTAGEIFIDGRALAGMRRRELAAMRRSHVGFVFQNLNLVPSLTAAENVSLPLELDRARPKAARAQAVEALHRADVGDLADRFPDELSGGERQRVAIARAVAGPRRLVLADEPTAALDELTGRSVMDLLVDLLGDGIAVVLVTHDAELAAYANRVVRLRDGVIDAVSQRPESPATAAELLS